MLQMITTILTSLTIASSAAQAQAPASMEEKDHTAVECLALNIYYETSSSSLIDAMAVSDVVQNRVLDSRYPDTVCGVVKQARKTKSGKIIRNKCQFSWYCDGKSDNPRDLKAWEQAYRWAREFLYAGRFRGITDGATHYHAYYVKPNWRKTKTYIVRVGSHLYYRWEK
jgi:spore germination cell wall hydrolase CwlJ-like protein